jgi:hypothetical protein
MMMKKSIKALKTEGDGQGDEGPTQEITDRNPEVDPSAGVIIDPAQKPSVS